jgi:hypothetical protein
MAGRESGRRPSCITLGLALATLGCGSRTPITTPGGAGAHGTAGTAGTTGASGSGGTTGSGAAGTSSDASADAPWTPLDGGDDAACGPKLLNRLAPDLLLLLDRSGSMAQMLDGLDCPTNVQCMSKWNECTKAVNQVVRETETSVRWGLKYFPTALACTVEAGVTVPMDTKNATAITTSIAATMPGGSTPTRLAVQSAAQYLSTLTDPNPKVMLLATDGLPNCAPGAPMAMDDSADAIAAVKAVADSGVPVYVIGIGSIDVGTTTLEQIAVAGGRPRAVSPSYYPVESSADLVDTLRAIGAQSAPCTYALPEVPPIPNNTALYVGNVRIQRDPAHLEGWDYDAIMKSIRLYGTWCDKDQAGTLGALAWYAACDSTI